MGTIRDAIETAFSDYLTPGVESSGLKQPKKSEIRAIGAAIESALAVAGLGATVSVSYATRSSLDADLDWDAGSLGLAYADGTDANNDIYVKSGDSGEGSWTLTTILHDIVALLIQGYVDDVETAADAVADSLQEIADNTLRLAAMLDWIVETEGDFTEWLGSDGTVVLRIKELVAAKLSAASLAEAEVQTEIAGAAVGGNLDWFRDEDDAGKRKIVRIDGDGTETDVLASASWDYYYGGKAGAGIKVLTDASDGTEAAIPRAHTAMPDGTSLMRVPATAIDGRKKFFLLCGTGQSLMVGGNGGAVIQTTPFYNGSVMMLSTGQWVSTTHPTDPFDPDAVTGLVPYQATGADTLLGFAGKRLKKDEGIHTILVNAAIGGRRYADLWKGTQAWTNMVLGLEKAVELARGMGYDVEIMRAQLLGEADRTFAVSQSTGEFSRWLHEDHNENFAWEASRIVGKWGYTPHFFLAPSPSSSQDRIPLEVLQFCRENTHAHWVGPILGDYFTDANHPSNQGMAVIGDSSFFRPMRAVMTGGGFTPLDVNPASGGRTSSSVSFQVTGATGNVRYLADSDYAAQPTTWGLQVFTSGGAAVTVSSVSVGSTSGGAATVTANTGSDPGAGCVVRGAWTAAGSLGVGAVANGAHTNIADEHTLTSDYDARAMPKRLGPFEITIA